MNDTKVLGLDISKSSVCAVFFQQQPKQDVRSLYLNCQFEKVPASVDGLARLLSLKPDVALLEPTGTNYSRLWVETLLKAGVEVRLIEHKALRRYREHLSLPSKNDEADALAIALYYYEYSDIPTRFVRLKTPTINRLREVILRLLHLNRVQSPIVNRIRQDLSWQFPEIARRQAIRQPLSETVPLMWRWLAEEIENSRYQKAYENTAGLGITSDVRNHAKRLCELTREEVELEQEIFKILDYPEFSWYRKVFEEFSFGLRTQAVILSQIHPFESFLTAEGKPEVAETRGLTSRNKTKKHLSLRRFCKYLGVAPSEESSGDTRRNKINGGSRVSRRALWQWVFAKIEVKKHRPKNEIGQCLGDKLDREKAAGIPPAKVRMRVASVATKMLFQKLVKARDEYLKTLT